MRHLTHDVLSDFKLTLVLLLTVAMAAINLQTTCQPEQESLPQHSTDHDFGDQACFEELFPAVANEVGPIVGTFRTSSENDVHVCVSLVPNIESLMTQNLTVLDEPQSQRYCLGPLFQQRGKHEVRLPHGMRRLRWRQCRR